MAARHKDKAIHQLMAGVFALSALGVVVLLWYVSAFNRPSRRLRTSPLPSPAQTSTSREGFLGGNFASSPPRTPQAVPRYIANLSTSVGEYIVSVRQVADFDQNVSLNENLPLIRKRLSPQHLSLSLQIMAANSEAIEHITEFALHVKATDNTGIIQESENISPLVRFEHGMARILILPAPPQGVKFYRSIEGAFAVTEKGIEKQVPFTLTNIPLPVENHLFGLAAASVLSALPKKIRFDVDGKAVIQDSEADILKAEFPPFTLETGTLKLPNRLILLSNRANRFPVFLPMAEDELPLICTLIPQPKPASGVAFTCLVETLGSSAKPLEWKVEAWENDPLILVFPLSHFFPNVRQTAGLRLLFFSRQPYETAPTVSPIAPGRDTQSGSLIVGASIGDSPLRSGRAKIQIALQGDSAVQSNEVTVELNEEGMGTISNVPPGIYNITVKDLFPYHNNLSPLTDGMAALAHRYHLIQPQIRGQMQQRIILSPGGVLRLKPWQVTEGKGTVQ